MEEDHLRATQGQEKEAHPEATGLTPSHGTGTSLTRFLICMAPVMVSLPGFNEISIEQPAILQVLSPLNATEEKEHTKASQQKDDVNEIPVNVSKSSEDFILHNDNVNDDANSSDKNLVSSSSTDTDHLVKTTPQPTTTTTTAASDTTLQTDENHPTPTKDCKTEPFLEDAEDTEEDEEDEVITPQSQISQTNILDIESHLIETLNEATPSKESVGINELQPVEDELQVGCSKVETEDNVRSVIEVQPAEVVTKQPIEQIIETDAPLQAAHIEQVLTVGGYLNGESHVNKEDIEKAAQQLLEDIEEEIVRAFETNSYKGAELIVPEKEEDSPTKTEASRSEDTTEEPTEVHRKLSDSSQITGEGEQASEDQLDGAQSRTESQLSQVVDQQISEVTSILESQTKVTTSSLKPPAGPNLKLVAVPTSITASEETERKLFIDSLPALQGAESSDAEKLALDCKREYYQSLKKYLVQTTTDKPPVPLQTYRWEDLRRARERGGYPWTHLYKRPLGPNDQPEIVLMLRKSQEIRFLSESPKSNKKVRIDDQVLIQETYPYLQELSEEEEEEEGHHSEHHLPRESDHENHSLHSESFSCVSDSVLATAKSKAANRFSKVRRLFRRRRYGVRSNEDAQSLPDSFTNASLQQSLEKVPGPQPRQPIYEHPKSPRCFPIMKKLKSMADRQKKRLSIKRLHLGKDDKVAPIPDEEPKIIKLKSSPKAQRSDIPHFIEKQDSDDILEIEELDESPSRKRLGRQANEAEEPHSSIVQPEEIIEISEVKATTTETSEEVDAQKVEDESAKPPKKAPRLRREHVYEEIDHPDDVTMAAAEELKFILDATSVDALKQSLATQDSSAVNEVAASKHAIPLDRMGSSEEEATALTDRATPERKSNTLLAPISSIDSASSDEDRSKAQLQPVTEEEQDEEELTDGNAETSTHLKVETQQQQQEAVDDMRLSLKREASPAPSEKKVTFSHVEDEADPHREDIELPAEQMEAAKEANKWKNTTKMGSRRSASVGALPVEKKHFVSRNESTSGVTLDVRCACQYFQSDSLLPERINPVDSRPSSKLDFHHDVQFAEIPFDGMLRDAPAARLPMAMHSVSGDRRLMAGDRITQPDPERQSLRSVGKHRSWDQASASVDISFVEKYPELEETAKSRGLVVRSISDDDPRQMPGSLQRQRFTSVDRMSNVSGHRDPETLSMHSVRSLRRISRSPSKGDLFVADINISQPKRREQRSVSASRRSSNVDLSHMPPQINVINPTPLPQMSAQAPSFQRHFTPLRSPSPPAAAQGDVDVDYRVAKPPVSVDYMRPEDNKENKVFARNLPGELMPQNRPIDMSKYKTSDEFSTIVEQPTTLTYQPTAPSQPVIASSSQPAIKPRDALEDTVAELEAIATTHNVVDIVDNIQIERLSPPLVEDIPRTPLNLDEETRIDITTHVKVVDIDRLVQEEEEKARRRAKSKSPARRFSPSRQMEPSMSTRPMERFSPSRQMEPSMSTRPMERFSPTRQMEPATPARPMERFSPTRQMEHYSPSRPMERFSPSRQMEPSTPARPMERFSPSRQMEPSTPARPMERFSPTRQMEHYSPSRPMERFSPSRQMEPSTPARPMERFSPTRQMEHYSPSRPTERFSPTRQMEPSTPSRPMERFSPSRQMEPSTPSRPMERFSPTRQMVHYSPSRPTERFSPTRQMEPSTPSRPMERFSPSRQMEPSTPSRPMDRFSPTRQMEHYSPTRQMEPSSSTRQMEHYSPSRQMEASSSSRQMEHYSPTRQMEPSSSTRQMERFSPSREMEPSMSARQMKRFSPSRQTERPSRSRQIERFSPSKQMERLPLDTLQVPQESSQQLKRGHSPERQPSPSRTKKMASDEVDDTSKPSYSSRFKSLFSSKTKEETDLQEPSAMMREHSPSPAPSILRMPSFLSKDKTVGQREKSPSPAPSAFRMPSIFSKDKNVKQHEKSPSPVPQKSKVMSAFSRQIPVSSPIMSGTNAVITNKAEAEPMSIKVQETFSLKVDEMDQYMAKPGKPPAPPSAPTPAPVLSKSPSVPKSMSSREDFPESERVSMSIGEAFAPVIIGRSASSQISIDQHNLPSEVSSQDRGLNMRSWSKEPSIRQPSEPQGSWSREPSIHHHPELQGKPLFSAPIMMESSGSLPQSVSPDRRMHIHGLRSPSEQRPMHQQTKQNFLDGRTQSQDRQHLGGSQDNLSTARMTKTVSFHFDERKSRLSEFENRSPDKPPNKNDFLDRTYFSRDHEYEPIGMPSTEDQKSSDIKDQHPSESQTTATSEENQMKTAEEYQREIEEQFFKPVPLPTPQTEIVVDTEELPDETLDEAEPPKSGMKSFMASAQDRTRKMQIGLKTQAGKIRSKLKPAPKKAPSGSPKAKERRKFKAPEFSKIKMPEMSKFKDFKRPEFTKFTKPDMSKFKLPEMSAMKLGRSKSFKESETSPVDEGDSENVKKSTETTSPQKKLFDFNFGTYPRVLRKKKQPVEVESSFGTGTATEATSVIPSTETQPSVESSSSPQGDRGPGPVRSRWADKFSDVSYNDSEGSRYRRYGSEQESFERESSLERRMREDLEDTASEEPNMGILGGVADNKEFAEFDEENRAIHEISNLRSGEFRRRPMVHQDSDVRSEEDAVGWTDREIQKNILLRKAEIEAEASYQKYQPDDGGRHDNQSTASSGKKVVLEEIGEDEFFLRKRGISQDNVEINQYIRNAFRDDYDKPMNALQHVGQTSDYGDYDVPPPKPRRLHKNYQPENVSQENDSYYGDDFSMSQNGSDYFGAPRRPMRKGRSRSKYSMESQEVRYVDDEYMHEPSHEAVSGMWNDLNTSEKENIPVRHEHRLDEGDDISRPQPPRRQKRRRDNSMDKDSYINGFGGRSVSNSFLQPTEDVIVYRTEHEYHHVPIATPDKYSDSVSAHKSTSHYDLDDQASRGAISLDQNVPADASDKYVIEMLENDGYAVVRKEQVPKPTPPARRKRFSHSPGDRFATMPNMRTKRSTPPPERPPPPRGYTPVSDIVTPTVRKSALSLDARPNYDEDDYEEPGFNGRPESPRNLQTGEIINKMKYRPLPPPPRPPREKRNRSASKGSIALQFGSDEVDVVDGMEDTGSHFEEVEASTQTDPLPDDFVCEEFEITDDMKIIEPRIIPKTIEDMLQEELEKELQNVNHQVIDSEQLAKGLQRFRDANQRSLSERSRASSQADRSKSHSRPQTPSAIVVERQSSTPVLKDNNETMLEASLIVRPIDDLELEEEELRREGLLTDGSEHSMLSDAKEDHHLPLSEASYAPSSTDIDEALGALASDQETQQTDEEVERTLQRYRDELDEIGRQLMETQTTSQELSPSVSREEIKDSDREEHSEKWETSDREDMAKEPWQLSDIEELRSDMEDVPSEREQLEEAEEEEEEAPFEKEFTPLPKESQVEAATEEHPLPPPRRKSTTAIEPTPTRFESEEEPAIEIKELAPMQTVASKPEESSQSQLPARLSELEVERLRVHALQAGQIMVSQLHGQQISADELDCKSGNIVVKNIELPPGLIEDIVERVRQTERSHHLTVETQTSLENSNEPSPVRESVPPPKPPRLRDLEATTAKKQTEAVPVHNADEQTQTEAEAAQSQTTASPQPGVLPTAFPTAEYLQSLAPLAFYNLHRAQAGLADQALAEISRSTQRHRRRHSASPEVEESKTGESSDEAPRRRRTRSTRTPSAEDQQGVAKAGRKFITACSLSLAKIINQLSDLVRGNEPKEGVEDAADVHSRHVPALAVLFIVITFCVLIFLLTGRNVHTHHWDYFNPPGQDGRPS